VLVVVLLLHQPDLLQSLRRIFFHLLRPVGRFPSIQEFDPRGCVGGSRTILLDMSRPGCRWLSKSLSNREVRVAPAGFGRRKCEARQGFARSNMTRVDFTSSRPAVPRVPVIGCKPSARDLDLNDRHCYTDLYHFAPATPHTLITTDLSTSRAQPRTPPTWPQPTSRERW
jgi:hypothetical protein